MNPVEKTLANVDTIEQEPVGNKLFIHPKIMLLDIDEDIANQIIKKGYTVSQGSLGKPYLVTRSNGFSPLVMNHKLPYEYKEQEIVVVDFHYKADQEGKVSHKEAPTGVNIWWASNEQGFVNPRIVSGISFREDFERILKNGGVFLIFSDKYLRQSFCFGSVSWRDKLEGQDFSECNWNILNRLAFNFKVISDHGTVIRLSKDANKKMLLVSLISRHLTGATYDCAIQPLYDNTKNWVSLLENKHGDSVGGVFVPRNESEGFIFVFPNLTDKPLFVTSFIDEILPSIVPNLFPDALKASWLNQAEYELPVIKELKQKIIQIEENTKIQIQDIQQKIQAQENEHGFLFDLARETGTELVLAVQKAFRILGFNQIIDADEELEKSGHEKQNREDIQIHDYEPTLILEVKGISHSPSDDDALTVQKYVVLRMKEWDRTKVKGLSVINHQRHIPPLNREKEMPFRQEIIDAAEEQDIGLITGWDFHRLVRSYMFNNWKHEHVKDIFYCSGRINIIPSHYKFCGVIEGYIEAKGVLGIKLESKLRNGDCISFDLPVMFKEQECQRIEFNNTEIEEADSGMMVGIKTILTKAEAKKGTKVYRLIS